MLFSHCVLQSFMFFSEFFLINRSSIFIAEELDVCPRRNRINLDLPWMTKDVWNMLTIGSAVSCIFGCSVDK